MPHKNATLFISDLHLDPKDPASTQTFFYFLEHIAEGKDALYILGDFFDAYIGDDDKSAFMQTIRHALSHATEKGLSIFLMHGNRDFLVGSDFALQSGVTPITDPHVITLYHQPILLMHGDSLCTKDKNYQLFRKVMRSRFLKKIASLLPLRFREKARDDLRKESMKHNHTKSLAIMDVSDEAVSDVMKKYKVNTLIHGHTHKPAIHDLADNKKRIVLHAWHDGGHYLEVSADGKIALIDIPETR